MFANHVYEAVKDENVSSPEFELFRHIRNASSHNNRFNFIDSEPACPASWRGLKIDNTNKGKKQSPIWVGLFW